MPEQRSNRLFGRRITWLFVGLFWLALVVPFSAVLVAVLIENARQGDWSDRAVHESQSRGNEIVRALEVYRAERGVLPTRLAALVPDYMAAVTPPVAGNEEWIYRPRPDGSFEIAFEGGTEWSPVCAYDSSYGSPGEWYIDTR